MTILAGSERAKMMTGAEQKAWLATVARLDRLLGVAERVAWPATDMPAIDSAMDIAEKTEGREAFDHARLLIFAAEDHLRALLGLAKDYGAPAFAGYTLLRAATDALVRARHLLDPGIDDATRLARGLNERLDNLRQQAKLKPDAAHFDSRLTLLMDHADRHSIAVIRELKKGGQTGKVIGFGEVVPTELALFDKYVHAGSTAFRFLSAFVHSKSWALAPRQNAQPSDTTGVGTVDLSPNVELLSSVLNLVLDVYDDVIGLWMIAAGFPLATWTIAQS
jgi:hypothetical protein